MERRTYRRLDVATKAVGLLMVAAALSGDLGSLALPVGLLGVAVGVSTVLLRPREDDGS